MKGISQTLVEQARKSAKEAEKKAEQEAALIELYNQHRQTFPASFPEPTRVYAGWKLYGAEGNYGWEKVTPEDALTIMQAFPPVASVLDHDGGTGVHPADQKPNSTKREPASGYTLRIDQISGYDVQLKLEWYTELSGDLQNWAALTTNRVRMSLELVNLWGITPRLRARITRVHDVITRISDTQIEWPIPPAREVQRVRYSQVDHRSYHMFLVWSPTDAGMLETVGKWAQAAYKRREESRKAYEEDKAAGLAPEPEADPYEGSGKLRAGTKAQYECLNTEEARKDAALARKHWRMYAEEHGIESTQGYFDHFRWACAWLERHNLLTDPNANGYKYGSAWL